MSIVSWEYESGYFKDEYSGKCMAVEHNTGANNQNVLLWSCSDDGQGSYRMWNYDSHGVNPPSNDFPTPVAPQTGSQIQWAPNPYYCLTVEDNKFTSGQSLVLMQCQEGAQGSMGQQFYRDGENGFLQLVADSSFCVASWGSNDGANIYLEHCHTMSIVSWEYESGYFKDEYSGKCMAVEHNTGANNQNVLLWSCSDDGQGSYRMWNYDSHGVNPPSNDFPTPVAPQTGSQIQWAPNPYYCLTVEDNKFTSGQSLVLMQCQEGAQGSMGQQFYRDGENGFLQLVADSSFCVASWGSNDGANIYLEHCHTMSIVSWEYESGYFKDEHSGKCMAVEHNTGANGRNVLLWSCNDDGQGSYRMWNYDSNAPSPPPAPQTRGSPIQWAPNPYYCLTVQDNQFTSGQNLVLMQCQEGYQGSMGQ